MGFGGVEPISFREILAYMKMFGINGEIERRNFLKRIHMIDSIYMELTRKKE